MKLSSNKSIILFKYILVNKEVALIIKHRLVSCLHYSDFVVSILLYLLCNKF